MINKWLSRCLEASGKAVHERLQLWPAAFLWPLVSEALESLTHGDLNGGFCALARALCEFFDQSKGFRCSGFARPWDLPDG